MKLIKRILFIAIAFACLLFLFSCGKGEGKLKIELSPTDQTVNELATTVYTKEQLSEIAHFNGTLDDLNAQYPIECIREVFGIYRISYLGDKTIAVILFDDTGSLLFGNTYSTQLFRSEFEALSEGQTLEQVRTIDPNGEYLFLYTGRNDTPKISSHYTRDGYLITVEYDDLNVIQKIQEEPV